MQRRFLTLLLIVVMVMSLIVAGCSTTNNSVDEPQDVSDDVEEEINEEVIGEEVEEKAANQTLAEEEVKEEPGEPKEVVFMTSDGLTIHGLLFGKGKTGVILSHMYPSDQDSWYDVAVVLAAKGYHVLTFDFRGYGNSEGDKDIAVIYRDVEAAWDFLEGQGIEKVFLIGASMGGTASLKVVGQRPAAGVVTLSSPVSFRGLDAADEVEEITAPKLFLAGEGNDYDVAGAQEFFGLAKEPKEIMFFPGSAHGTDMLEGEEGLEVLKVILDFVDRKNVS